MTNSSNLPTRGNCNVSSCGTFENGNAESNTPLIPLYIIVRSALKTKVYLTCKCPWHTWDFDF